MSPEAIAAFCALGFTVVSAIALGAYHMGSHSNRIASLETRQQKAEEDRRQTDAEVGALKIVTARLEEKFDALAQKVEQGFEHLAGLIAGRPRSRTKAID